MKKGLILTIIIIILLILAFTWGYVFGKQETGCEMQILNNVSYCMPK